MDERSPGVDPDDVPLSTVVPVETRDIRSVDVRTDRAYRAFQTRARF